MTEKTTAESFYEAIAHIGAGSLYYLTRKNGSKEEYMFEPVILDTKNKDLTINILKRVMLEPNFIAFPGTPEAYAFMNETVVDPENK
jgi:hypothetical protein